MPCLSFVAAILLGVTAPGAQDKEFRQDWLDKDLAMARSLAAVLKDPPRKAADLVRALDATRDDLDRDAGFQSRQQKLVRYGGYTSCWITLTTHRGEVVDLTLFQDCPEGREDRQRAALLPEWKGLVQMDQYGLRFHWESPEVLARARRAVEAQLGKAPTLEVPDPLAPALAMLTSPREIYDYGAICYYGGVPPKGREALEAILAAKRADLLRAALRSLNPEGRVYAVEGLLRMQKDGLVLSAEDQDAMELVRSLSVPLGTCNGCIVTEQTAAEALKGLER